MLGGSVIGDGSVVGVGSVLKSKVPNNAIAVGVPARVTRKDVAWERPHLSLTKPYHKPDASTVAKTEEYWNLTEEPVTHTSSRPAGKVRRAGGKVLRALRLRR